MPKLKPGTIWPTPEEEAAINAGIAADPDTFELDAEWFAKARPAVEVDPILKAEAARRARALQNKQQTEPVTITTSND